MSDKNREFVITDAVVLTMDAERRCFVNGYVWVRNGQIWAVGDMSDLHAPGVERRTMHGHRVVMPGIVNAHTHLESSIERGLHDNMSVEERRSSGGTMWRMRRAMDPPAFEAAAAATLLDLSCRGVTTTTAGMIPGLELECGDGVLSAATRSGVRVLFSRSAGDDPSGEWMPPDFRTGIDDAIANSHALRAKWASDLVEIGADAIHDLYCSDDMLKALHEDSIENDVRFFMHLATQPQEVEHSVKKFGVKSIERLDRLGCLVGRSVFAHGSQLDEREIELLARRQAGLAVCPGANIWGGGDTAKLAEMIDEGVRVGLGTDGAATNNTQDPWEAPRLGIGLQRMRPGLRNFGSAELGLELLTIRAAEAVHLDAITGSLEPGKSADIICVEMDTPALIPSTSIVGNLVYSPDASAVRDVYVAGEQIVASGEHLRLDGENVVRDAQSEARRVHRSSGLDQSFWERSPWTWFGR